MIALTRRHPHSDIRMLTVVHSRSPGYRKSYETRQRHPAEGNASTSRSHAAEGSRRVGGSHLGVANRGVCARLMERMHDSCVAPFSSAGGCQDDGTTSNVDHQEAVEYIGNSVWSRIHDGLFGGC